MSSPSLPPFDPRAVDLARQKRILKWVVVATCMGAVVIVAFAKQLPLPARLFLGAGDVIVALTLWLLMRQKFSEK